MNKENLPSNLSLEEREKKLLAMSDEEIDYSDIPPLDDNFFAHAKLVNKMMPKTKQNFIITNIELPQSMVNELDTMATELNINREAVIKMILRRSLDEHYIAKNRLGSPDILV
jgi:hypothetical protein